MASSTSLLRLFALMGTASAVALTSCTLPPEQAWRKIRDDGLIAYWSYEMRDPSTPANQAAPTPKATAPAPAPVLTSTQTQTTITPLADAKLMDTGRVLTAQSVPALPGYVRSPYTNPPRLVDVKGTAPGTTMICPYTQRPFIVPADFDSSTSVQLAQTQPKPAPQKPEAAANTPIKTEAPAPSLVLNNKPVTAPDTKPQPSPAATTNNNPAPPVTANNTPAPVKTPSAPAPNVQDVPFGSPITGRPGFVNSPFAARHQLVDVTGLPTGMEVKCPYTGKLFRVPPQDVATTKDTAAPLSSPEEPKKN